MKEDQFGNSKAAIDLSKLVEDHPTARRGVSNILKYYREHLFAAFEISNIKNRNDIMNMIHIYHLTKVEKSKRVQPVKSFLKNVMYSDIQKLKQNDPKTFKHP